MTKYQTLINVLDVLRKEAPESYKFYHPLEKEKEKLNQARSRALIHLFLKVKFGLIEFEEREKYVVDGTNDGGIDGYFIDKEKKMVYFIQSKFRTNQENFESREIKYEELLNMDVDRILDGETTYENGISYSSKILNLIKEIQVIDGIVKYNYEVVILANTKNVSQSKLRKLTGGIATSEFNFNRTYEELLFPIVTGTFYEQSELVIEINLGNKSSEDISYSVDTEFTDCEISALFVPTIEIAKSLYKYKNSILKYNPRSYLDMATGSVNTEIAKTILTKTTNEFALFNNGITMLSDDTSLNKKIAKKETGQLIVTNPQIINGGQTAYTLSRIYEDILEGKVPETVFENKEVLLKVITFEDDPSNTTKEADKLKLIEAISKATNQQTVVSEADRRSNDKIQIELQRLIYEEYGLFYQRKTGEYGEGLRNKYISRKQIIDRELLLRLILSVDGKPSQARRSGEKVLFKKNNFDDTLNDSTRFKEFVFAYKVYEELNITQSSFKDDKENRDGIINYGHSLRYGKFGVISAVMSEYSKIKNKDISETVSDVLEKWQEFEDAIILKNNNGNYFREIKDLETGTIRQILNFDGYYKGRTVNQQIKEFKFI